MAQVPDGDQLLVDAGVHLAAVPETALQQEAAAAGLQDWGRIGGSWGRTFGAGWWRRRSSGREGFGRLGRRSFRYLSRKCLGYFNTSRGIVLDILAGRATCSGSVWDSLAWRTSGLLTPCPAFPSLARKPPSLPPPGHSGIRPIRTCAFFFLSLWNHVRNAPKKKFRSLII